MVKLPAKEIMSAISGHHAIRLAGRHALSRAQRSRTVREAWVPRLTSHVREKRSLRLISRRRWLSCEPLPMLSAEVKQLGGGALPSFGTCTLRRRQGLLFMRAARVHANGPGPGSFCSRTARRIAGAIESTRRFFFFLLPQEGLDGSGIFRQIRGPPRRARGERLCEDSAGPQRSAQLRGRRPASWANQGWGFARKGRY